MDLKSATIFRRPPNQYKVYADEANRPIGLDAIKQRAQANHYSDVIHFWGDMQRELDRYPGAQTRTLLANVLKDALRTKLKKYLPKEATELGLIKESDVEDIQEGRPRRRVAASKGEVGFAREAIAIEGTESGSTFLTTPFFSIYRSNGAAPCNL